MGRRHDGELARCQYFSVEAQTWLQGDLLGKSEGAWSQGHGACLKAVDSHQGHPGPKEKCNLDFKARTGENFCAYPGISSESIINLMIKLPRCVLHTWLWPCISLECIWSSVPTQAKWAMLFLTVSAEEYRLSKVTWHDGLSKNFGLLRWTHHIRTPTLTLGSVQAWKVSYLTPLHLTFLYHREGSSFWLIRFLWGLKEKR